MAPHHRAVDVAAGHERACVSTDSSRRLDEPEEESLSAVYESAIAATDPSAKPEVPDYLPAASPRDARPERKPGQVGGARARLTRDPLCVACSAFVQPMRPDAHAHA